MVTNQIISYSSFENGGGDMTGPVTVPALGNSWAHFVNIRLVLQFVDAVNRQVRCACYLYIVYY